MVKALSLAIFSSGPTALIAFSTISLAAPESSARSGQIKARTKLHEKRCQRILHMIHLQDCTGPTIRENCRVHYYGWMGERSSNLHRVTKAISGWPTLSIASLFGTS